MLTCASSSRSGTVAETRSTSASLDTALTSGILVDWLGDGDSMRDDIAKVVTECQRRRHGNKSNFSIISRSGTHKLAKTDLGEVPARTTCARDWGPEASALRPLLSELLPIEHRIARGLGPRSLGDKGLGDQAVQI